MNTTENTKLFSGLNLRKSKTMAENCRSIVAHSQEPILKNFVPADKFLREVFRSNHRYGSRDRFCITSALFAFYRWRGWLTKSFGERFYSESELTQILPAASAAEGLNLPVMEIWCKENGLDYAAYMDIPAVEEPEKRFRFFVDDGVVLNYSDLIPEWMHIELTVNDREKLFRALQQRSRIWLRIQRPLISELEKEGLRIECHPRVENALKILNERVTFSELATYNSGGFEVQDFSSQCIGLACMAQAGESWWDACAGGGGKTLQLASMMRGKGTLVASDVREYTLKEILKRARRAGFGNIRVCEWDGTFHEPSFGMFDGVLVDAPCSSSGRWRRNPETRWAITPERLEDLNILQKKILEEASRAVKPNGLLIYATCSLFECENTGVINEFMKKHPEFTLESFPNPHNGMSTDGTLHTMPWNAECDASFVARMRKN